MKLIWCDNVKYRILAKFYLNKHLIFLLLTILLQLILK